MSDLIYQTNRCRGWINPSTSFGPNISNLNGYYSPAGSTTLVSISGTNFLSYSTVSFGTYKPTPYFINSNMIQFYIPIFLNSGIYPVQVFNGSIPSNSVNYTIDNASGYWLLMPNGVIVNTNTTDGTNSGLVNISSLSRGAPTIIESVIDLEYTVPNNINWFICDSVANITITLPPGTSFIGREIMIKSVNTGSVLSNTNNIIPLDKSVVNASSTSDILVSNSKGKWVTLVSNGTFWIVMQGNT
jgi:hypothetical protein